MSAPARQAPGVKLLVVEDQEALRHLYAEELVSEGYVVRTARDVGAAEQVFDEDPPDVVVLDIRLGDGRAVDTMSRILSRRRAPRLVLNTAVAVHRDDLRLLSPDAYIVKSSDLTELKSAVRALALRRSTR
jgi:DNA-binding response OmpR family regulator